MVAPLYNTMVALLYMPWWHRYICHGGTVIYIMVAPFYTPWWHRYICMMAPLYIPWWHCYIYHGGTMDTWWLCLYEVHNKFQPKPVSLFDVIVHFTNLAHTGSPAHSPWRTRQAARYTMSYTSSGNGSNTLYTPFHQGKSWLNTQMKGIIRPG